MSLTVEKLEGNMAKLTIEATAEEFENALNRAYLKNKNQITLQGFRKGKAPRAMIERVYGEGVFFEDAANLLIPDAYAAALETEEGKELDIVSRPEIDLVQVKKGEPFIFTAEVALRPKATLGAYKDLGIEKKPAEVTEEDINAELDRVREQNSRMITVEDRPVQDKDIVTIDFEGFMDGTPFEGGKGEDYNLTIGSHSFIDTFEDQLIGKNTGDDCEVNVTFPENYQAAELAGKPALFKVKIKKIQEKELPELNDEFAEEVSEFDTLSEYKEDVRKKLADQKEEAAKGEYRTEVLKKIVENAEMVIPDPMIDYEAENMVNDYAQRLKMQGLSIDMYMQYTGQTMDQLKDQMKDQARTRIENSVVLEAIAEAENIEVSDEDIDAEIKKMAENYQMEEDKLKEMMSEREKDSMRTDLKLQKALDLITEI
ncbi:MAG: trigger factor [Lachnospiraceae bacterium]|nr:trigger factor [Lachnospiraceae bacterium]